MLEAGNAGVSQDKDPALRVLMGKTINDKRQVGIRTKALRVQ